MSKTVGQVLRSENDTTGKVTHRIVFSNIPGAKIQIQFPLTINEGDVLFLNKPTERLEYQLKEGKITQEQYEKLLADYENGNKSFVRFEVKEPLVKNG